MQLGFLSFVPNHGGPNGGARALEDGLALFQWAEELGFDTGWVRARHFEPFMASPLTFLAAASQRTTRIHLGTGVIPLRYEDPIRLAEDASSVDLLSGGRLELGLSTGIAPMAPILDPIFGATERSFGDESQHRLERVMAALRGETLGTSGRGFMSIPADKELTLTPLSAGLAERVWYGPGTVSSAARTGHQGFDLQVSTLNGEETGKSFELAQYDQIMAYKQAFAESHGTAGRTPRINAGRIILPLLTADDEAEHRGFLTGYASRMYDDGRPHDPNVKLRFSRVHSGEPSKIVDDLLADPALAEATQLTITLPDPGSASSHRRILENVATLIAPALGWAPAHSPSPGGASSRVLRAHDYSPA